MPIERVSPTHEPVPQRRTQRRSPPRQQGASSAREGRELLVGDHLVVLLVVCPLVVLAVLADGWLLTADHAHAEDLLLRGGRGGRPPRRCRRSPRGRGRRSGRGRRRNRAFDPERL